MKRIAALVLAIMCMCSFAHGEELKEWIQSDVTEPISEFFAQETLITATGSAKVNADIDIATLVFSVEAEGETVAQANAQIMGRIETITSLIKEMGVPESEIWHRRYDVTPNVVYHNTKFTEEAVIDGYTVEIVLCVRLTDISLVGQVIDSTMQSGAGTTHELEFERSTAGQAYNDALVEAAQLAMERAKYLAEGSGMTVGDLVSMKELSTAEDGEAIVEVSYYAK